MTYTVYVDSNSTCDVSVEADGFEINMDTKMVMLKLGLTFVGAFKLDKIIGIARDE